MVMALRMASAQIVCRVFVDSSGQEGWRPEHRGRDLQIIEVFDHGGKYPVWIGGSILSSLNTFRLVWIFKHHEF